MEAKQKGSSGGSSKDKAASGGNGEGDDSLDLVAYVEFQKYYLYSYCSLYFLGKPSVIMLQLWTLFVNFGRCSFNQKSVSLLLMLQLAL
jgi:hypothetical protein